MKMKLAAVCGSLILAGSANAAFTGMSFDDVSGSVVGLPAGLQVFRVYANFDGSANNLLNVSVNWTSSQDFVQSAAPFGTNFAPNPAFIPFDPTLNWDTWVTVGDAQQPSDTTGDPDFQMGASSITGGWYDGNPGTPVTPTAGRILLAQLTVAANGGSISGPISLFWKDSASSTVVNESTSSINIPIAPAPGALALLGLAGLVGSRRRRG